MIRASKRLDRVKRIFDPYLDRSNFVRLDRNEDPVGWDKAHFDKFMESLTPHDFAAYSDSTTLMGKLAEWLHVKPANILITAGSDAVIKTIFETYVDPEDEIVLPSPGWRMYDVYADIYQAKCLFVEYDRNLNFDVDAVIEHIQNRNIRLVVLANPSQPTGTLMPMQNIERILQAARDRDVLVVIDEAYYLFTSETVLPFLGEYSNLIIARTFSKAFGLAGLRLGYCIASEERIREMMSLRPVTDSNSIAIKCGEYVLDHMDWMQERIGDFVRGRDFLWRELDDMGFVTFQSFTNFVLVKCRSREHGKALMEFARERGYLLKGPFAFSPLEDFVRISVGPEKLMKQFVADCRSALVEHAEKRTS